MLEHSDVVIIGGGPAGSSAGIALAALGHRVHVLERRTFPRFQIGESLPPKVGPLLELLGVQKDVDAAGFVRMAGTTTSRGAGPERHLYSPKGVELGHQVDRGAFDQILLERSRSAGCSLVQARVEGLVRSEGAVSGVVFRDEETGTRRTMHGKLVLDASGGARVIARRLGLTRRSSEKTVALYARWKNAKPPRDFPAEDTVFEMQEDGWIWSVLLGDGTRSVTVGFDVGELRHRSGEERYHSALARSELLRGVLEGAVMFAPPRAHDATWYDASAYAGPGFLLLGDAGFVADPLTSQGVYKAIHSGLVAASVMNTITAHPSDTEMATSFYDRTQERLAATYGELARSFYEQSGYEQSPFWRDRARAGTLRSDRLPPVPFSERARRRSEFMDQLTRLGGDRLGLRARPELIVEMRAVASEGLIRNRACFVDRRRPLALGTIDSPPGVQPERLHPLLTSPSIAQTFQTYAEQANVPGSSETARGLMETISRLIEEGLIELVVSV